MNDLARLVVGALLLSAAAAPLRAQTTYDSAAARYGRAPTPSGDWRYEAPSEAQDDSLGPQRWQTFDRSRPLDRSSDRQYDAPGDLPASYDESRGRRGGNPLAQRDRYGNIERTDYEWHPGREQARRAALPEAPAFRPGVDSRSDMALLPDRDYLAERGTAEARAPSRGGYRVAAGQRQYQLPPQGEVLAPQPEYAQGTPGGAVMYDDGAGVGPNGYAPQGYGDGYGQDGYGPDGYGDDGYGAGGYDNNGRPMYYTPCPNCGGCCGGISCPHRWFDESSVFVGVHAFEGGLDQGQSGNFGFQEGVNFAGSLWHQYGIGYQVGAQFLQSDLTGSNISNAFNNSRQQTFLTVGLFHRPMFGNGLQGGVVFDWLDDSFYTQTRFSQIRGEISYITMFGNEFGFWGAFNTGSDQNVQVGQDLLSFSALNMYNFFYRKNFANGNQGRIWGGFTGNSGGMVGADYRVHLSNQFDMVGGFNYLILGDVTGLGSVGPTNESWGLSASIVWYPTRAKCGIHNGPFRQLFNVADNNVFMIRQK